LSAEISSQEEETMRGGVVSEVKGKRRFIPPPGTPDSSPPCLYHPWDPGMAPDHMCAKENDAFGTCLKRLGNMSLNNKHIACYSPQSIELMKCLGRFKRGNGSTL